jgi:peroxiredoxin
MSKNILATLLLATLLVAGAVFLGVRWPRHGPVAVGEAAPDFTLPCLGRSPIALRDYRRQVVVLNFWATWCPPCVEETPSLERFSAELRKWRVAVIGVSVDQDQTRLEKFVAGYRLSFPIARDPEQALASRYGTSKFPETYILDRDGKVAEKVIGAIDWQDPRIIAFVEALAGSSQPLAP